MLVNAIDIHKVFVFLIIRNCLKLPVFYIKTKKPAYRPSIKQGTLLKKVPKEYLSIVSFDWFNSEE